MCRSVSGPSFVSDGPCRLDGVLPGLVSSADGSLFPKSPHSSTFPRGLLVDLISDFSGKSRACCVLASRPTQIEKPVVLQRAWHDPKCSRSWPSSFKSKLYFGNSREKLPCFHLRFGDYRHTQLLFTVRDSPRLKTREIGHLLVKNAALKSVLQGGKCRETFK